MKNKTWSGRFKKQIDEDVLDFSQSLTIDIVLYEADILVTEAHVEMLCKCGHIKQNELRKIRDPQILKLAGVNSKGSISGCGMDMLFHAQYTLFHNLHTSYKKANYQRRMPQYKELI